MSRLGNEWSKILSHLLLVCLLVGAIPIALHVSSENASATTSTSGITLTASRQYSVTYPRSGLTWFAQEYYWVVYLNTSGGYNAHTLSSKDGVVWGNEADAGQYYAAENYGLNLAYYPDGKYVHVMHSFDTTSAGHYRRGEMLSNGTIEWGTAYALSREGLGNQFTDPSLVTDSDGYLYYSFTQSLYNKSIYLFKNANRDGTWLNATANPIFVSPGYGATNTAFLVRMMGNKIGIVLGSTLSTMGVKVWNGATLTSVVNTTSNALSSKQISAVAIGDDIYFSFLNSVNYSMTVAHYNYTLNSIISETVVNYSCNANSIPSMSITNDSLYVFYGVSSAVYYAKSSVLDPMNFSTPVRWFTDSVGITANYLISQSLIPCNMSRIPLIYSSGAYKVKFANLDVGLPSFSTSPELNATQNRRYESPTTAHDPQNDSLTYSLETGPNWLTVGPISGLLYGTPRDAGNYSVVVRATDGYDVAYQNFTLTILPDLGGVPGVSASFEYTVNGLKVEFVETTYNGSALRIWSFGDGWGSTNPYPTHRYENSGTYLVTMIAYDQYGHSNTAVTTITVDLGSTTPLEKTGSGWRFYLGNDTVIGVSAVGLLISGAISLASTWIVPSVPFITTKARVLYGVLAILAGLYFIIFDKGIEFGGFG